MGKRSPLYFSSGRSIDAEFLGEMTVYVKAGDCDVPQLASEPLLPRNLDQSRIKTRETCSSPRVELTVQRLLAAHVFDTGFFFSIESKPSVMIRPRPPLSAADDQLHVRQSPLTPRQLVLSPCSLLIAKKPHAAPGGSIV